VIFKVVAILCSLLILVAWVYAFRYIIQYDLGHEKLRIKLFGLLTVRKIRLADIAEVRLVSCQGAGSLLAGFRPQFLFAERWPSYGLLGSGGVYIKKRAGLSRRIVLSPRNPEEFLREITRRIRDLPRSDRGS
jgi:hypothetical protein